MIKTIRARDKTATQDIYTSAVMSYEILPSQVFIRVAERDAFYASRESCNEATSADRAAPFDVSRCVSSRRVLSPIPVPRRMPLVDNLCRLLKQRARTGQVNE